MQILRYPPTAKKCGVCPMTIWRWATQPECEHMNFPKPITLGPNSVGFIEAEVDAWLEAQAAKRDGANAAA